MLGVLERFNKISWIITIILGITIFYVSSIQFKTYSKTTNDLSAIYHFGIFLVFSFFLLVSSTKRKRKDLLFLAVSIAILYGILDEIHQLYVPGRSFTLEDIFLDSLGVLIALALYSFLIYKKEKTSNILKT